ncbi:MAG TPA: hypothetical protein VE978_28520 [Chitinophagales bacterium]|nr:hypothetical protein [Chitinophagales bacterium]
MLNFNKLHEGNHILHKGFLRTVISVEPMKLKLQSVGIIPIIDETIYAPVDRVGDINGISLTPELLNLVGANEKNGIREMTMKLPDGSYLNLHLITDGYQAISDTVPTEPLYFVHQLQNYWEKNTGLKLKMPGGMYTGKYPEYLPV